MGQGEEFDVPGVTGSPGFHDAFEWGIMERRGGGGERVKVERVECEGELMAILIPRTVSGEGIHFFTPSDFSQQLGYMNRPAGYRIVPHVHKDVTRDVRKTQEVLFIRSGSVRIDFYTTERRLFTSRELRSGDVILLASGGHGITMLEPTEIVEVKQGPYAGDEDKQRFDDP
jgi:hypothetical protein